MRSYNNVENETPILVLSNAGIYYWKREGLRFTRDWIIRQLNFQITKGETVGLIGKNGAGKSTVLKLLGRIIDPDEGDLKHDGYVSSRLSLGLGFMALLSGYDNIYLSASLYGLSEAETDRIIDQIIEFSGLAEYMNSPVATYSTGMKARLGFSIALHSKADLLLIDEVLSVGDEDFRKRSQQAIIDMSNTNRAVVIVSHNMPVIRKMCDRVSWLSDGKIIMSGKPDQIVDAYLNNGSRG